jgi:diguanylate cyclase (GGDEF)-like protein
VRVADSGTGPAVPEERDRIGVRRDRAAHQRDQDADQRDQDADQRDQDADQRDLAADQRDQVAERAETWASTGVATDDLDRAAAARQEAASDRRRASQDRRAGARERAQAEFDRGASARERASSSVDDLTGVYLRRPGSVELGREIARARRTEQPLVLAFIDVDGLKGMNDSRGHAAGDRLLLEVAKTIRTKLRAYDLIIRYGGDEFVCAISGLNMAQAKERLALVNPALAQAPEHGSVTIGLAELQPGDSPDDLVARADAALYQERQRRRHTPG